MRRVCSVPYGVCVIALLSPLRGLRISHITTHGLRRGLHSSAALRLERREFPARMQVVHLVASSPRVRERVTAFQHLNREDR